MFRIRGARFSLLLITLGAMLLAACGGDAAPSPGVGTTVTSTRAAVATATPAGPRGALDSTFGDGGLAVFDMGSNLDEIEEVLIQPDGKIIAVGHTWMFVQSRNETMQKFGLARFNADGSLDTGFGTNGKTLVAMIEEDVDTSIAYAAALLPDGKILVAGTAFNPESRKSVFAMTRLTPDGKIDNSFGVDGGVLTMIRDNDEYSDQDVANAIAVDAEGRIVLAGSTGGIGNHDFALARFEADGNIDNSFGEGGVVTINRESNDEAQDVAIQPDGKIVVAGTTSAAENDDFMVARLNEDGSIDADFGSAGVTTSEFEGGDDIARPLLLRPDGKIIVGGYGSWLFPERCQPVACEEFGLELAQYNADGSPDTSFGTEGKVHGRFNRSTYIDALALLPDGKILGAGNSYTVDFALVVYNADGTLDNGFGVNGIALTTFKEGINGGDRINAVALQPDGKIIAAGIGAVDELGIESDFAIARYLP